MNTSSDSAEQLIRLYLDGTEFTLKITGSAIKNIAVALYTISKDTSKSKGKARLSKMLRSEKELKIFSIKKEDMKIFAKEAKGYGVLYCALRSKSNQNVDDMIDILVRAEDAPKVNRIIERFKLTTVDKAKIKSEIEKEIAEKQANSIDMSEQKIDIETEKENIDDTMVDDIFSKPQPKEQDSNLLESPTDKDHLLEHSSTSKIQSDGATKTSEKKSVKKELEKYKKEEKIEKELKKNSVEKNPNIKNEKLNNYKVKKNIKTSNIVKKERGK